MIINRLWAQLTLKLIKMSDSPDRKRDYVKFNGINFPQWRYAVMLKLRKKKLEDVVLGIEKKPTDVTYMTLHQCTESNVKLRHVTLRAKLIRYQ